MQPGIFELLDQGASQQRCCRRYGGHSHTQIASMANQLAKIFALGRVTTREYANWGPHLSQLLQDSKPFLSRQLSREWLRNGLGAAVVAGQVTGPCNFPDSYKRCFLEISPGKRGMTSITFHILVGLMHRFS